MTNNDAIKWLKHCIKSCGDYQKHTVEVYKKCVKALGKQIPIKIDKVKLRPTEWGTPYRCAMCEAEQMPVEFMSTDGSEPKEKVTYCWHCGQKIDWSDEE